MPKFPVYQQQTILDPNRVTPEQAGASLARGMGAVGQALSQTGDRLLEYQRKKDADWMAVKMAEARSWGNETLSSMYEQSPEGAVGLPESFNSVYDEQRKKILEEAPFTVRNDLENNLEILRFQLMDRASKIAIQASADKAVDDINQIISSSANSLIHDPDALADTMVDVDRFVSNQPNLPAGAKRDLATSARETLAKAAIRGMDPEDALARLEDGEFDDYLSPEVKTGLIGAKSKELKSLLAEEKKAMEAEAAKQLSDLEINVNRGAATYGDIEEAYNGGNGWLKPNDRTRLTLRLDKLLEDSIEAGNQIEYVNQTLALGGTFDPKSPKQRDRKAINAHYESVAASWKADGLDASDVLSRSLGLTYKYGMVPDTLKSIIRGNVRHGSSEQRVLAASMLTRMSKQNPELLKEFDNEDIELGVLISQMADIFSDPTAAIQAVNDSLTVAESTKSAREDRYRSVVKDNPTSKWIEDKLNPWWGGPPDIPPSMAEEIDQAAQLLYITHGNIDAAREAAYLKALRTWGETDINGEKQMMRFAPEKFYGVPGMSREENTQWIKEQLMDTINKDSFGGVKYDKDKVFMIPHETARAAGGLPAYRVITIDSEGVPREARDNNQNVVLYVPDFQSSKKYKQMQDEMEKQTKAAKEKRALKLGLGQAEEMKQAEQQASSLNLQGL